MADSEQIERMKKDRFICELLGISLDQAEKGYAAASLTLGPQHLNGIGIVQGGVLFSLADYTFAAAANYADPIVSLETTISFIKPAQQGRIVAEAREVSRTGRFSVVDVRVSDDDGQTLALFHGRGYVLKK